MPYACLRATASEGAVEPLFGTKPQFTGHITARTPCIPLHRAR